MPRIPEYDRSQGLSPTFQDVGAAGTGFRDLAQLGQGVSQWAADRLEKQKRAEDAAWIASTVSGTRGQWTQELLKARETAPAGAADFTRGFLDRFDQGTADLAGQAPSEEARAAVQERLALIREGLMTDALVFEGNERVRHRRSQLADNLSVNAATVRADPNQYDEIRLESLAAIQLSDLPAPDKDELARETRATLAVSQVNALTDRNPAAAKAALLDGRWAGDLSPAQMESALNAADVEIRRRQAEAEQRAREARAAAAAEFSTFWRDELASVSLTGQRAGLLSDERILALIGEEKGQAAIAQLNAEQQLAIDKTRVALMSDAEFAEFARGYDPAGEGFADEASRQAELAKARADSQQDFARDPAAAAALYSPATRAMWQQAARSQDPGEVRQAIWLSLNTQEQVGVPETARRPLTQEFAAGWVAAWQKEQSAAARLQQLSTLTAELGDDAIGARVLQQLEEAGLPKGLADIVELGRDPGTRNQAERLLAELTVAEPAKLPTGADDPNSETNMGKAVRERYLAGGIGEAWAAMQLLTGDPAYGARAQDQLDKLTTAARQRTFSGGDASAAADGVYADLLGGRNHIADPDGIGAVTFPADIPEDTIETGLETLREQAIARVTPAEIKATLQLTEPADEVLVEDYVGALADELVWIDGAGGYVLIDRGTGRAFPIKGKRLTVTLDNVLAAAALPDSTEALFGGHGERPAGTAP